MVLLESKMSQTLTHWAAGAIDVYGSISFGAPTAVVGRFEQRDESVLGADGEERKASNVFFLPLSVAPGDYLAPGDQTAQSDPKAVVGAVRVISLRIAPDLSNNQTLYMAFG